MLLTHGARPDAARAHRRPADTGLIGRTEELRVLDEWLRDPAVRLVTLTGAPGAGKSRLAGAAAEAVAPARTGSTAGSGAVPGAGVTAVVDCDPADPGAAVAASVRAGAAGGGRVLLLLDGCDHEARPAPVDVTRLLDTGPGVVVLATALEPLGVLGERLFPVPPLPVPPDGEYDEDTDLERLCAVPSVELFTVCAARARPGFAVTEENGRAVAGLCALLDGLPAALELAAARTRWYEPATLLSRLRDRPGQLHGGPAGAPERHRSLTALAEYGCRGLPDAERALLDRLCVYRPGFGTHALERADEPAVDGLLDRGVLALTDRAGAEPRYAVREPFRSYRGAALEGRGELTAARDEHAERYHRLVTAAAPRLAGTEQARWLAVLGAETANVLAALEHSHARGATERAATLVLGCRQMWPARGLLREGVAWCDRLAAGVPQAAAVRLNDLGGELTAALGDPVEAVRRHRTALADGKRLGDRGLSARITAHLGAALLATGDAPGALASLEPAVAALEAVGAAGPAARATTTLAAAQHALGHSRRAADLLDRGTAALRRLGDLRGLTEARYVAALLAMSSPDRPDPDEPAADAALREALELCRDTVDLSVLPRLAEDFALLVLRRTPAQQPRVVRLITAARTLRRRTGSTPPPAHRAALEEALTGIRSRLGWSPYALAGAEGRALDATGLITEALSAPPAPPGKATGTGEKRLTARQLQVALLVSEGLTNRQIAARLDLSEWTVVNHVRQIMRRLDCASRVQVAWAIGKWT
ncbi:ATP-binding protein [Streptomyces murinus]|uniref:ATP-binding protein n=1 Tax=Streptomyces murinus TaxID=33900 RepID=UPI00362ED2C7